MPICTTLRNDPSLRFELCSSVSGVDYLGSTNRLHSVYHLTSMTYRRRIRLEVAVSVEDPHVPSVTALYPTADWQERETYDMFGITFEGNRDLRRIYMPLDYRAFPLRKDFYLADDAARSPGAGVRHMEQTHPPRNARPAEAIRKAPA